MLGGLYQSVLRAELTDRFGVAWGPIVHGQAEIAGVPDELLDGSPSAATAIEPRHGRQARRVPPAGRAGPVRFEHAALEREASADTRSRKSGNGVADLTTRWQTEAAELGWTVDRLDDSDRGRPHTTLEPDGV